METVPLGQRKQSKTGHPPNLLENSVQEGLLTITRVIGGKIRKLVTRADGAEESVTPWESGDAAASYTYGRIESLGTTLSK